MIRTVTFNPAIDNYLYIDEFSEGKTNRVKNELFIAGGKGINVSRLLSKLETNSIAYFFCDQILLDAINTEKINEFLSIRPYMINGFIRSNIKIIDKKANSFTEINKSNINISEFELDGFIAQLYSELTKNDIVVISGSLHSVMSIGKFKLFLEELSKYNVKIIIDTSGAYLLEGLHFQPWLIKPNFLEYINSFNLHTENLEVIKSHINRNFESKNTKVLLSLGSKGVYYYSKKHSIELKINNNLVENTVGAGDALLGAYLYGLNCNFSEIECVKFALAAANVYVSSNNPLVINKKEIINQYQKLQNETF